MFRQYLSTQDTKRGKGVFSSIAIPAGQPILEITGTLYQGSLPIGTPPAEYLQVGPNSYLGMSGTLDDHIAHSCDPNCWMQVVGNRAILYSLYVIPKDGELTFDYATTSNEMPEQWTMMCKCGSFKCRKVVSGYSSLSGSLQAEYKSKGMIPLFLTRPDLVQRI